MDNISKEYEITVPIDPDYGIGLKIDFKDSWIHLRKSNTEPILRIYAESNSKIKSIELIDKFKNYFIN